MYHKHGMTWVPTQSCSSLVRALSTTGAAFSAWRNGSQLLALLRVLGPTVLSALDTMEGWQDRNFVVRIQSQCHNHISPPAHSERLQEVTWQCVEPRSVLCVCGYMHLLSCRQGGVIQSCSPWSVLQPAQETLLAPLNNFITKSKTHEPHQGYARSLS